MKSQKVMLTYSVAFFIMFLIYGLKLHLPKNNKTLSDSVYHNKPDLKYILQWKQPAKEPFSLLKVGQSTFFERNCAVNNCYVTRNRTYFSNPTDYDAILFYCVDLKSRGFLRLWRRQRSNHQKYVFVCPESAGYYPVSHRKYNSFFNMTWTYKLDSDVFYGYIVIRDKDGKKIVPKKNMHWLKIHDMKPIDNKIKRKLNSKRKVAAWFVSNCNARSGRKKLALKIKKELNEYNMTVDIYGKCSKNECPRNETCSKMLENDYYFYFSFENSINEDYVTEKLLIALQHYTVPIVYGGANYTRFMPDGIYLNARTLPVNDLVKKMVDIINDKEKYYDFFRWRNHYTFHNVDESPETDPYCNFCKKMNDPDFMNRETIKNDLVLWWNGWNIGGEPVDNFITMFKKYDSELRI